ncbi:hypothetical protein NMD73_01170 [Edwardsiella tarda]|uniref:hypothetical protein n=1 Tax=Edwardsiella tarda TaxID=636 RepID=UPI00351C696F
MRWAWGLVIGLLPCLVVAARDPFAAPRRMPSARVAASAAGLVADARCFTLWQRDAQGQWRPAVTGSSPRINTTAPRTGQRLDFPRLARPLFPCPSHAASRFGGVR